MRLRHSVRRNEHVYCVICAMMTAADGPVYVHELQPRVLLLPVRSTSMLVNPAIKYRV